ELDGWGGAPADERRTRLSDLVGAPGDRLRYEYDFGDSWEHDIVVEKVLPGERSTAAVCVGGRRAGPPEDCGGVWGYAELCEIMADPTHPEHAERAEWIGGRLDPARFDAEEVNRLLQRVPIPTGPSRG
ncbi:MAG TPA: plasmid pRiA4b ORF-3 family protein, partial [Mycobacteriales bacterium]|nr:plasmid pRiA4b ORF-3 family protein [Mycobacteriales bacterium]